MTQATLEQLLMIKINGRGSGNTHDFDEAAVIFNSKLLLEGAPTHVHRRVSVQNEAQERVQVGRCVRENKMKSKANRSEP
jgi:ABC-type taurine transport system ATPase subunit